MHEIAYIWGLSRYTVPSLDFHSMANRGPFDFIKQIYRDVRVDVFQVFFAVDGTSLTDIAIQLALPSPRVAPPHPLLEMLEAGVVRLGADSFSEVSPLLVEFVTILDEIRDTAPCTFLHLSPAVLVELK